jgi:hypothetical protein
MRLLPPATTGTTASTRQPASASEATLTESLEPSPDILEYGFLYLLPVATNLIINRRHTESSVQKENSSDTRGKPRVLQDFLQIIDEVGAIQSRDPLNLVVARRLKVDSIVGKIEASLVEEPVPHHPSVRDLAQIDTRRVEVPEFGLVAYDENACVSTLTASRQKSRRPFKERGPIHLTAVDFALQPLPLFLSPIEPAKELSHADFAAAKIVGDQFLGYRGLYEDIVIADDSVVEVYTDPKRHKMISVKSSTLII